MNLDIGVSVARFAAPGETVVGYSLIETPGGKSSNQAVAAALLGGTVRLIGAVGRDTAGETLLSAAIEQGIDIEHVVRVANAATGRAIIHVDANGENTITVVAGANEYAAEGLSSDAIKGSAIVCLALEIPDDVVLATAHIARRHGATTILNVSPYRAVPDQLWPLIDILLLNQGEAAQLLDIDDFDSRRDVERLIARLRQLAVGRAVVTLGSDGALILHSENKREFVVAVVPTASVDVVDTTGCGDAFTGALAKSVADGASLIEAVAIGNAAGSFAAQSHGAQTSYADSGELERWIAFTSRQT